MMLQWEDSRVCALDLETSGSKPEYALQPWRHATGDMWITDLVHVVKEGDKFVNKGALTTPFERPDDSLTKKLIARTFEEIHDLDLYAVGWNTVYDVSVLLAYGFEKEVFRTKWLDGLLLWRHWFVEPEYDVDRGRKKSYGLKECFAELCPHLPPYNDDIDFHDPSPAERAKLHRYAGRDGKTTFGFARHWFRKLEENEQRLRAALIEAECIPLVAQANLTGIPVDTLYAKELTKRLEKTAAEKLLELAPHGVTKEIVRSPLKLAKLLFEDWGLPVYKYNDVTEAQKKKGITQGNPSTDKETLFELSFEDERTAGVLEYRGALNQTTKFATAPLASAEYNGDGRTHPSWFIFSTYSSRMTCASNQTRKFDKEKGITKAVFPTGIALHQWKREKWFRQVLLALPDHDIVEQDAAGQEYRWMAEASGDETMMSLCEPGEDPHSFMGSSFIDMEYHALIEAVERGNPQAEQDRYLGKFANLSCVPKGTLLVSDRGVVCIEDVRSDDRLWDGVEFVRHGGVICNGLRGVISYAGLEATPDHQVLVRGRWVDFAAAKENRWEIDRPRRGWPTVRVVGGIVAHHSREIAGALRASALRMWAGEECQSPDVGGRSVDTMPPVRVSGDARSTRKLGGIRPHHVSAPEARQRHVPAVHQPERPVMAQLRRAWDRVSVWLDQGVRRVHLEGVAGSYVCGAGHRPGGQQRPLRTGEFTPRLTDAQSAEQASERSDDVAKRENSGRRLEGKSLRHGCREALRSSWDVWRGNYRQGVAGGSREAQELAPHPREALVYDVLDCGPRNRFVANGLIVHNCQYRTGKKKLRAKARVDYGIMLDMPTAERIHSTYQLTYPGVPVYWKTEIAEVRRRGYQETFAGRRVQVTGDWTGDWGWSMGSTAINYKIQGTGGDQKYLAFMMLKDTARKFDAKFAWDLHDGLYWMVPRTKSHAFAAESRKVLDNLPYTKMWGYTPQVPMPWDTKIGGVWGSLEKFKG